MRSLQYIRTFKLRKEEMEAINQGLKAMEGQKNIGCSSSSTKRADTLASLPVINSMVPYESSCVSLGYASVSCLV
jgi:hypothetical protein